jgi:pyruvate,water dikinase
MSDTPLYSPLHWLADIGLANWASAGHKGASLGELLHAGIRVPEGFVVSTRAFELMVDSLEREHPVRARVAALNANDPATVTRTCKEIRRRIESSPLPRDIHTAVTDAYRALSASISDGVSKGRGRSRSADMPVAVRSSTTINDNTGSNFAGLLDSFLWVRGVEGVLHAVRSCWASLYNVDSVKLRRRFNLPENRINMGVVVQSMVNSQCAGVMYTRNPATGDRSVVTIDGCWGLGSGVMSRDATPDRFIVSKVSGDIVSRTISDKRVHHLPDHFAGGVRIEPVPEDHQKLACLPDAQIVELAQIARRIERHFGASLDIEWAMAENERSAYILKTRVESVTGALPAVAEKPSSQEIRGTARIIPVPPRT